MSLSKQRFLRVFRWRTLQRQNVFGRAASNETSFAEKEPILKKYELASIPENEK
jgi:hypothetical protein